MNKIIIHCHDGIHLICPKEIVFCKSDNCYTTIYLVNLEKVVICKSLTKFFLELDEEVFVRINQSYVVNKNMIKKIVKKGRLIQMIDGSQVPFTKTLKELLENLT